MPRTYPGIGIQIPEILLPAPHIDTAKWAVIACDQFTSQPEYWQAVKKLVGESPSAFNMILPEAYLHAGVKSEHVECIHRCMQQYLAKDYFQPVDGMVYVERSFGGQTRRGMLLSLDLEQYHYERDASSLIRATEGTIQERLNLRIQVRQGGVLELPHILVLIDDPQYTVIEPVSQARRHLEPLYDFELMMDSGHLAGWLVDDPKVEASVIQALQELAQPKAFSQRYGVEPDHNVLLYAVGDGNHSLAAAKVLWDELKQQPGVSKDHPARYALVELQNLHDDALCFEPIHRVLYGVQPDLSQALCAFYGSQVCFTPCRGANPLVEMADLVNRSENGHAFGVVTAYGAQVVHIANPDLSLTVSSVQAFLDDLKRSGQVERMDYIHGADVAYRLGMKTGNASFYLPPVSKDDLFRTIILNGALPLKTFSIGEARHKRFYMESRKLTP